MRRLLIVFFVLLAVIIAIGAWLSYDYARFLESPLRIGMQPVTLRVAPGASLSSLSRQLEVDGIITHRYHLMIRARLRGGANQIRAGEYHLIPGILPDDLLKLLSEGREVQYSVTLVEGWTVAQVLQNLAQSEALTNDLSDVPLTSLPSILGLTFPHPEGVFLPETYFFTRGTLASSVLKRAAQALEKRLNEAWENRSPEVAVSTPYEALILASIIEKETALDSERTEIAGVFTRRLKRGMRLQTDPTVIYGMGNQYTGRIRRSDLQQPSPYNTYVIDGLPPTPIALAGWASIQAAVQPKAGQTLFFVARGDGSHYFSVTLEEHNQAVRKYILNK